MHPTGQATVSASSKGGWKSNFYPDSQALSSTRMPEIGEGRVPNIVKELRSEAARRGEGGREGRKEGVGKTTIWGALRLFLDIHVSDTLAFIKFAPGSLLSLESHN